MSFRHVLSTAAIAALTAIGAAHAGDIAPKSYPGFTSNSLSANNIASGHGNQARQGVFATQSGSYGGWPGYTSNSIDATNLAAGYRNHANQDVMARQSGGGIPTVNSLNALNLAAGAHNRADQRVMTDQR